MGNTSFAFARLAALYCAFAFVAIAVHPYRLSRNLGHRSLANLGGQDHVDIDRQMRTVILVGGHRQHRLRQFATQAPAGAGAQHDAARPHPAARRRDLEAAREAFARLSTASPRDMETKRQLMFAENRLAVAHFTLGQLDDAQRFQAQAHALGQELADLARVIGPASRRPFRHAFEPERSAQASPGWRNW